MTTYRIETLKGDHTGTLHEIAAWQAEHQGAAATLVCPDGTTVDVDGIDFNRGDLDATVAAMLRAIREEVFGMERGSRIRCECGVMTGRLCDGFGDPAEMVMVEWMPEHFRASHEAAGNAGEWPHNGASRVLCLPSCAEACVGPWATVVPPEAAQ